ncbi:AraC family transcriptional regulator, partial [Nostoc sp. NIES-2111]
GYSMMAFLSAIEPLRVANRLSGRALFLWKAWTFDGKPAPASNGMAIDTLGALDPAQCPQTLIVVAGFGPEQAETRANLGLLRRLARQGVALGALDTGPHLLAAAGLLEGHRACMHWEAVPGFREDFPDIAVSDELFGVSPGRFTCAGGTAALDMMLHMIGLKHGQKLAVAVSEQFIHDRIRDRSSHQRMRPGARLGVTSKRLLRIV